MAKKTRDQLDAFFEDGDTPDASEFGHLIDSMLNLADTGDQEIAGDVKILGTMSASVVGAESYAINGLSLETTVVTENQITGSNIFGSQSAASSPSGVTSHSFFGPIHQSSSGAHSGSHFLTPVSLGATFDNNPLDKQGLYIEKNKTIGLNTSSLTQTSESSLLIRYNANQHLAFDANEIHQFGDNLNITAQGLNSDRGNIAFRTSVNPTSAPPHSMMISSSGVVGIGIGTDVFDAPLHTTLVVSGNISSSGGLDLDGNITASGAGPHTFGGAITASIVSASGPIYASSFVGSANFSGFTLLDDEQFKLGTGEDFKMFHQSSDNNTFLIHGYDTNQSETVLAIRNISTDGDIVFQADNGLGNQISDTYVRIDGGDERVEIYKPLLTTNTVSVGQSGAGKDFSAFGTSDASITMLWDSSQNRLEFSDSSNAILVIGNNADLGFLHNGTDTYVMNSTGDLRFEQRADDKDIIFLNDNGSGGVAEYFRIDGSSTALITSKNNQFKDSVKAMFGDGNDLQIYHDSSNSYIDHNGAGALHIRAVGTTEDLKLECTDDLITNVGGQMDLRSDSHVILDADRNNSGTGDLYFRVDETTYFQTQQSDEAVKFNKEIILGTTPVISKNVSMGFLSSNSGLEDKNQSFQVEGSSNDYLTTDITIQSDNPKFLVNASIAIGAVSSYCKALIKVKYYRSGWVDGQLGDIWLFGGSQENGSNGGMINVTLNNFIFELHSDHNYSKGAQLSFAPFIYVEQDFYVNRCENGSDTIGNSVNSYLTVEEIPQSGG